MKFQIKHRHNGSVLFECKAESLKVAVELAVKKGANLMNANLMNANLRNANLRDANLWNADLWNADLRNANLWNADLRNADLRDANLWNADLMNANLRDAKGVNKYRYTPLTILQDQVGKIRAYKIVNDKFEGIYKGGIKYEVGKIIEVETLNTDDTEQCGAGINLATLDWCLNEWIGGRHILICEFSAKDQIVIPIATDGKFRVKRCKVVKEIDYKKYGIDISQ